MKKLSSKNARVFNDRVERLLKLADDLEASAAGSKKSAGIKLAAFTVRKVLAETNDFESLEKLEGDIQCYISTHNIQLEKQH